MKSILFSGVHGVGKGYFLDKVKEYIENYNLCSASTLIERYRAATDAGYKKVNDVNGNQDVLIKAIKEEKSHSQKDFILDGHLCIFDFKGDVVRVPEYFFNETGMNGIILLQDEPKLICDRLKQRDSNHISIHDIGRMQEEEKKYAEELKCKYEIDYILISHECTGKQFQELLKKIGER